MTIKKREPARRQTPFGLHAHTGRCTQGRHDGRRYRCDDLHNPLNGFFLRHNRLVLVGLLNYVSNPARSRGQVHDRSFRANHVTSPHDSLKALQRHPG